MKEYWDLYDEDLKLTDKKIIRDEEEIPDGYYHLSVELWIINSKKELLLIKSAYNYIKFFPGKWKCVTGNLSSGEDVYQCIKRNGKFRIGIDIDTDKVEILGLHKKPKRKFAYYTAILQQDIDLEEMTLNKDYFLDMKYVNKDELLRMCDNGEIAYYLIERLGNEVLDYIS